MKSGLPKTLLLRRQPFNFADRKSEIILNSVSRFPVPRIRDITWERLVGGIRGKTVERSITRKRCDAGTSSCS